MKPLLLANRGFVLGGGEIGLEILVSGLLERGIEPRVVLPTPGPLLADAPIERIVTNPDAMAETLRSAAAGCDVVHTYSVAGFEAACTAALDLPLVLHALVPNPHSHDRDIAARAGLIICNSHATAQRFRCSARVVVIYNGVPEPVAVDAATSLADPLLKTIAIIGPISPRKGQLDALPALLELTDRRLDTEVLFIGRTGGPHGMALRRSITGRARVRAVGFVPRAANQLPWCDLVLVPSRSEGFGRMAAEALRAGVPVLARPIEGLVEALDGVVDPWLPDDPAHWSGRIEQELDNPTNTADELRAIGRRFDVDRFVDGIVAAYGRLATVAR